jgi:hypothetical protein
MLPPPIEHRFTIDHEPYLLLEWDRGGERRIKADYAMAIAAAPSVLEAIDGANLYAEAVARECLREAPALFWETRPAAATQNGTPTRVVSVEHIPRALWERFRTEVDAFLAQIFPPLPAAPVAAPDPGPADAVPVAAAETVPAMFRGRAE